MSLSLTPLCWAVTTTNFAGNTNKYQKITFNFTGTLIRFDTNEEIYGAWTLVYTAKNLYAITGIYDYSKGTVMSSNSITVTSDLHLAAEAEIKSYQVSFS